jgi:hypothetical protein
MSGFAAQLSLQNRVVSPEAMEQEAKLLNFTHSLLMSFHQKELQMLVASGVELLIDPRDVLPIKKFMQEHEEKCLIVSSEIGDSDTQTAFGFWSANKVPGCQGLWPIGIV